MKDNMATEHRPNLLTRNVATLYLCCSEYCSWDQQNHNWI